MAASETLFLYAGVLTNIDQDYTEACGKQTFNITANIKDCPQGGLKVWDAAADGTLVQTIYQKDKFVKSYHLFFKTNQSALRLKFLLNYQLNYAAFVN